MQSTLLFLSSLMTFAAARPPSAPPSGSSEGPSGAAWVTLVCGIASWFFLPLIASVIGIVVGRGELKAIREGRSPASGELITKIGYYISIANVVLTVVGGCLSVALVVAIWGGLIAGIGGLTFLNEFAQQLP